MTRKASAPIIILIVLILISLALAGGGFYLFQGERKKNLELQDKLEEISTKQRITEKNLEGSKRLIADLQVKLQEAKNQIDTLGQDLQQEKAARQEALAKIELVRADLEQQKTLRSDLEKKFNQGQDELRKTQAQLKDLDAKKTELETKVKGLEQQSQGVELGKIVVSPEAATLPAAKGKAAPTTAVKKKTPASTVLEGKVLVVNKDYNFAVINIGSQDGVNIGNLFSVYHNNKYIGDVKVEKVHDSMAAAGFGSNDIKDKVSEGDKVVQKVK